MTDTPEQAREADGQESAHTSIRHSIAEIAGRMDVPLGYTLSVWGAGHESIRRYGEPAIAELFLFTGGAVLGYVLVSYTIAMVPITRTPTTQKPALAITDLLTVMVAVSTSLIAELIPSETIGYFVTPLLVTVVYLVVLGILDHFTLRMSIARR